MLAGRAGRPRSKLGRAPAMKGSQSMSKVGRSGTNAIVRRRLTLKQSETSI